MRSFAVGTEAVWYSFVGNHTAGVKERTYPIASFQWNRVNPYRSLKEEVKPQGQSMASGQQIGEKANVAP